MEFIVVHNRRNNSLSINIRIIEIKRIFPPFTEYLLSVHFNFQRKKFAENPFEHLPSWTICPFFRTFLFSVFYQVTAESYLFLFSRLFLLSFILIFYQGTALSILFFFLFDMVNLIKNKSLTKIQVKIDIANCSFFHHFQYLTAIDPTKVSAVLNVTQHYTFL